MSGHNQAYLQIAFNHTYRDFKQLIKHIPQDRSIIVEAGTPFLKRHGVGVLRQMRQAWSGHLLADFKVTDGAVQEVEMAARAGATWISADGAASQEALTLFVKTCRQFKLHSVVDMLNVERPMKKLWKARVVPDVVTLHLGRDEENSYGKVIRYKNIAKIKGKWDVLCGVAGGIDQDQVSSALFNNADIVVVNAVKESDPWSGLVIDDHFGKKLQKLINLVR
jgi:bifunctional enzyme Fae/Hps